MLKNVLISKPRQLAELKRKITKAGPAKLQVVADFDQTLTKLNVAGRKVPSLISVLRDEKYLTPDYPAKAYALFNKYAPIEKDPKISVALKKKAMREWWTEHFQLLIKSGLNLKDVKRVVNSGIIKLRAGAGEFFRFLQPQQIPIVIMSSTGLGGEAITLYLKKQKVLFNNIFIVANVFRWDKQGRAVAIIKPIIHSLNKDETIVKQLPFYQKIKERKNVILLGNTVGDVGMVEGFDYDNLIKIGFLNEEVEKNLKYFKKVYDLIILNDGDFKAVNELMGMVLN